MTGLFLIAISALMSAAVHNVPDGSGRGAPEEEGYEIRDSILMELASCPVGKGKLDLQREAYLENHSYPWAVVFLENAVEEARWQRDTSFISYCLYNLAVDALSHGDTVTVSESLEELGSMRGSVEADEYYFRLRCVQNNSLLTAYQFDKVIADLDKLSEDAVLRGLPSCVTIVDVERILLLTFMQKYDEAIELCKDVISRQDSDFYEKFTAYIRLYEQYVYLGRYQESIEVLDGSMDYMRTEMQGESLLEATMDANHFLVESDYVLSYCALGDAENAHFHLGRLKMYYVDSFKNTNYLIYHYLCYIYHSLVREWDLAESELDRMLGYRMLKNDINGMRNDIEFRARLKYDRGQKDSACFYYRKLIMEKEQFYDSCLEEQRTNVRNDYLVKKAESDHQRVKTLVLFFRAVLLLIGIILFLVLYFKRSSSVQQEKRLTNELERSYRAAEQHNADSEHLLRRVREWISEPLDKVVGDVDRLSDQELTAEQRKVALSELTADAWNLNSTITDFLNRVRSQMAKPVIE